MICKYCHENNDTIDFIIYYELEEVDTSLYVTEKAKQNLSFDTYVLQTLYLIRTTDEFFDSYDLIKKTVDE